VVVLEVELAVMAIQEMDQEQVVEAVVETLLPISEGQMVNLDILLFIIKMIE
jgi:hypothetical protein